MSHNVRVRCGVYEIELDLAGRTVAALRQSLGQALNIDPTAMALVRGVPVPEGHTLEPGDSLEFVRAAGQKG